MATELKFHGMRREVDILVTNARLSDYIGSAFVAGARRTVSPETAREFRGAFDSRIRAVSVFVGQNPEEIAETAAQVPLDCIQLYGNESEESLERVHVLIGKPVWRAFQVMGNEMLVWAEESRVDFLFSDSGKGSGKTSAREWLRDFSCPYMLAGGSDVENVGEAIRTFSPRGVDVSPALETDGQKDSEKMRALAETVRRVDSETER